MASYRLLQIDSFGGQEDPKEWRACGSVSCGFSSTRALHSFQPPLQVSLQVSQPRWVYKHHGH